MAQADGQFRDSVEDIANLRTRNDKGEMVPIGSMVSIGTTYGPDPVIRYNGFPAADLIGDADPRVLSSTQAMGALTQMAGKLLPNGMNIQWTDLSYQQSTQGNAALVVFPVAVLLAFLALAALYESWTLPLAVILIVPMTMLSALFGVADRRRQQRVRAGRVGRSDGAGLQERHSDRRVRPRAGNAGQGIVEAALEACRLRLRPIVMTSIAFIAGTIPLILGHGAGAEVRGVTGITVFSGMLGSPCSGCSNAGVLRHPPAPGGTQSAAADGVIIVLTCKRSGIARPFYACEPRLFTGGFGLLLLGGVFRAGALVARSSSASESATVWRASTASEACSASFTTDLKYQQALALTRQRAGTSGREAQMRLSSITAR